MQPQIVIPNLEGAHNAGQQAERMAQEGSYRDQSTLIVCPSRGVVPFKVLQSWMQLVRPMNQKVMGPIGLLGMEVGAAYQSFFEMVLANPDLSTWKYVLTIEEDNILPPDALIRLLEAIEGGVDNRKWDSLGALYWTKGEMGRPMIYGDVNDPILNFRPQVPLPGNIHPCHGLGMGCTLWRLSWFKENASKMEKPWFKTVAEPGRMYTQDLYFYERAKRVGIRVACDTRVRVGHYDYANDFVW